MIQNDYTHLATRFSKELAVQSEVLTDRLQGAPMDYVHTYHYIRITQRLAANYMTELENLAAKLGYKPPQ